MALRSEVTASAFVSLSACVSRLMRCESTTMWRVYTACSLLSAVAYLAVFSWCKMHILLACEFPKSCQFLGFLWLPPVLASKFGHHALVYTGLKLLILSPYSSSFGIKWVRHHLEHNHKWNSWSSSSVIGCVLDDIVVIGCVLNGSAVIGWCWMALLWLTSDTTSCAYVCFCAIWVYGDVEKKTCM